MPPLAPTGSHWLPTSLPRRASPTSQAAPPPGRPYHPTMSLRSNSRAVSLLALLSLGSLTGCYEETVAARGVGSSGIAVQESRRSNTAADRWFDSVTGNTPLKAERTGVFSGSASERTVPDRLRSK